MLTTTSPIELKTAGFTIKNRGFDERIRGNYMLMGAQVADQTFTHMVNTPPEILIAEGSENISNTLNSSYVFSNVSQTVINNAVNRILISADMALNYQDRVFISSVLSKLGIKDERRFMEEVKTLLSETRNTMELTNLYANNSSEIRDLIRMSKEVERPKTKGKKQKEEESYENRLYVNIFNRLKTGLIYQIVQNHSESVNKQSISYTETDNIEQSYTARQILLQKYREMTLGENIPMIYRADNVYEEETRLSDTVVEEKIKERLSSAMFLEVIRNFDHAITLRNESVKKYWTDFRNSFFHSTDNVMARILLGARELRSTLLFKDTALTFIDDSEKKEIKALTDLIVKKDQGVQLFNEAVRYYTEVEPTERIETTEREMTEAMREKERVVERNEERRFFEARTLFESPETGESLEEEIARIDERNRANVERYQEIRNILLSRERTSNIVSDRERTIRESLKALNNKEHILEIIKEQEKNKSMPVDKRLEKIYKLLPEDTVTILKQLETTGSDENASVSRMPEAELAEKQINDWLNSTETETRTYTEQTLTHADRYEETSITKGSSYEELYSTITKEIFDETHIVRTINSYERLLSRQITNEQRKFEEMERISRIEENPVEITLLESLITREQPSKTETFTNQRTRRDVRNFVNMIYKVTETLTQEDVMEQLEEFRRNNIKETKEVTEQPEVITTVSDVMPTVINQTRQSFTGEDRAEIAELVERGVQRQLSFISSEVYSRLEKRLKSEKARRGF